VLSGTRNYILPVLPFMKNINITHDIVHVPGIFPDLHVENYMYPVAFICGGFISDLACFVSRLRTTEVEFFFYRRRSLLTSPYMVNFSPYLVMTFVCV
jgi:hypothetical protein